MTLLANILIGLVAVLHIFFMALEMFLWDKPYGMKVFGHSVEDAKKSKVLAQNQGLYNGFLAAGLIWGLFLGATGEGAAVSTFFLACIFLAGIYGYITTKKSKILMLQAFPSALAWVLLFLSTN